MSARICQSIWPSSSWVSDVILWGRSKVLTWTRSVSYTTRAYSGMHMETHPVEESLQQLGLEVVHGGVSRGLVPACRFVYASIRSE